MGGMSANINTPNKVNNPFGGIARPMLKSVKRGAIAASSLIKGSQQDTTNISFRNDSRNLWDLLKVGARWTLDTGGKCVDTISNLVKNVVSKIDKGTDQAQGSIEHIEDQAEELGIDPSRLGKLEYYKQRVPWLNERAKVIEQILETGKDENGNTIDNKTRNELLNELADIQNEIRTINEELDYIRGVMEAIKNGSLVDPSFDADRAEQILENLNILDKQVVSLLELGSRVLQEESAKIDDIEEDAEKKLRANALANLADSQYRFADQVSSSTRSSEVKEKADASKAETITIIDMLMASYGEVLSPLNHAALSTIQAENSVGALVEDIAADAYELGSFIIALNFEMFNLTALLLSTSNDIDKSEADQAKNEKIQKKKRAEEKRAEIKEIKRQINLRVKELVKSIQNLQDKIATSSTATAGMIISQIQDSLQEVKILLAQLGTALQELSDMTA